MRRLALRCALTAITACLLGAAAATAAPVHIQTQLTSSNGRGSYDATLACPTGDGPSWSYQYTGAASALLGSVGGDWSGTLEVHRGTSGQGFMPPGTGRVGISVPGRGVLGVEFSGGDCATNPLALSDLSDEPTVSGSLPFHVTLGTDAYRFVSGTGTASLSAALTKGADNAATITLDGSLTALQPNLTVGGAVARWPRIADWLGRNISVAVPVLDDGPASTTGDAFDVQLVSATVAGAGPTGLPPKIDRIDAGKGATVGFSVSGVNPGATYTATLTFAMKDALGGTVTPVVVQRTFKAPLTPLNII